MKIDPTVKPILRENSDGTNTGRKSETTGRVENVLAKTGLLSAVTVTPGYATDDALNQPGVFHAYNAYLQDRPLVEAVRTFNADWAGDHLQHAGALIGSEKIQQLTRQANRHLPELCTHDRFGHRLDVVEFHPAYHELMQLIYGWGTHSFAWTHAQQGGHVARGVLSYLWNQGENGVCCPIGMTFAAIPALRHDDDLLAGWAPLINSQSYDPRAVYAKEKAGCTVGMAITEKQGGSDLRATITTARPASVRRGSGAPYLITGHKWFFSVPMSDLFLTLAQTDAGLSCFLTTGWLPDGSHNRLKLQRLKDKCGNKSNASSEVEFHARRDGRQVFCCCGLRAAEHGHGRERKFTLERRLYPMKKYKRVPRPTDDLMSKEQGI